MEFAVFCRPMKSSSRRFKRLQPLLGTYVAIELQGQAEERLLNQYITEGFKAIAQIEQLMSFHRSDSDLTRLNRAKPNVWMGVISPFTVEVLKFSNELFQISQGVFDIRCGSSLVDLGILPAFERRKVHSRINKNVFPLEIKGRRVKKTGPWILDLGGIAKGYAVDRAVARIKRLALKFRFCGVVNAGGDLCVWGNAVVPMAVRIQGDASFWMRPFKISRTAAATSSVRTRFSSLKDVLSSEHVQMPQGKPLKEIKTVTVFANQCLWADALTKVVLLGSTDVAARCLSSYKARALVFGSDGQLKKVIS